MWHYQVRKRKTKHETIYDIVEVYSIRGKRVWTVDSIAPISTDDEGKDGLIRVLEMMLKDAKHYPVLPTRRTRR